MRRKRRIIKLRIQGSALGPNRTKGLHVNLGLRTFGSGLAGMGEGFFRGGTKARMRKKVRT